MEHHASDSELAAVAHSWESRALSVWIGQAVNSTLATTFRLILVSALLASAAPAEEAAARTAGMQMVRVVAEAEALAASCGLRLDEQMRDKLPSETRARHRPICLRRMFVEDGGAAIPVWRIATPEGSYLVFTPFDHDKPDQRERVLLLISRFMAWKMATS